MSDDDDRSLTVAALKSGQAHPKIEQCCGLRRIVFNRLAAA
jgi:hypothetical protein